MSIIRKLEEWTRNHADYLRSHGITLEMRIPSSTSNIQWKASVNLAYEHILVSYTVWERTYLQSELLVFNSISKKTVYMHDAQLSSAEFVDIEMDEAVVKLLNGEYSQLPPLQV